MSTPTKQEHHGSERWDNPHHPQKDKKIEDKSQKGKGDTNEHEFCAFFYIPRINYNILLIKCSEIVVRFWIFTKYYKLNQCCRSIIYTTTGQLEEFFDLYFLKYLTNSQELA